MGGTMFGPAFCAQVASNMAYIAGQATRFSKWGPTKRTVVFPAMSDDHKRCMLDPMTISAALATGMRKGFVSVVISDKDGDVWIDITTDPELQCQCENAQEL